MWLVVSLFPHVASRRLGLKCLVFACSVIDSLGPVRIPGAALTREEWTAPPPPHRHLFPVSGITVTSNRRRPTMIEAAIPDLKQETDPPWRLCSVTPIVAC
ncbi:hypothetical protein MHEL_49520 [Mycolicibacterium helvum]|uniref:Uncharacterized protein n=1 Tax=Mycolicibacterium helvum TaxID=1534349 RepID=A0A7I7TE40_9MYCO|nr:hypothetical protein MHEL_49520 [Mycolicibacterium helvum]